MPKPKNKKNAFIDKKNSLSFHLVHRSQQDPLAADNEAPQHVLQPITKIKEEERAHGVFYEDEYNYLQHLKDRSKVEHDWSEADRFVLEAEEKRVEALQLPSTVFPTAGQEEEIGLLNKAAPRGLDLSLDPEVVAALDDDFDFEDPENVMEDDFFIQAMEVGDEDADEGGSNCEADWEDDSDDCAGGRSEDEEDDKVPSLLSWTGEETATKFTNYSMSSSCIRRNQQLALLDDQFDKFMDQYGEMEDGPLDGEEIEGTMDEGGERMQELLKETAQERATARQKIESAKEVQRYELDESDNAEEDLVAMEVREKKEKWDCESVLSNYSTLYNHPKLISEPSKIRLSAKSGIPPGVLGRGLTAGALKQLDSQAGRQVEDDLVSMKSRLSELSVRPRHETPEEKRGRKADLKVLRRERREERKANTNAFKSEKKRQEKIAINVRNNVQGLKIC